MRLKSAVWVAAYVRLCHVRGAFAVVRRRGAEEAGAIFVKVSRLDGTATLYAPAPQSVFEDARPGDRRFVLALPEQQSADADVEAKIARELKFDSDLWLVEVEDRAGRHFLELAKE